jgi:hypothetical protein
MYRQFRVFKESSTTPLAGNGVWTSQWVNVEQYNHIRGLVKSDQGGTLLVQHSDDGVNPIQTDSITVTGGTDNKFDEICYSNWARIKYTNGATIQTIFSISLYADPFK